MVLITLVVTASMPRMSRYFRAGGLSLWNPSNRVADLFIRTSEAVAVVTEVPSGIRPMIADEHEIDPGAFVAFVDALTEQYLSSSHVILRSLLEGFLATALVLADRLGREMPSLRVTASLDPTDVSAGVAGIRPRGSLERLLSLADAHASAMPR